MNKTYYTPHYTEVCPGFECEVLPIGDANQVWTKHMVSRFDIGIRLDFIEQIRVQHLHEDHFRSLGMKFELVPRTDKGESYIASASIKHPREKTSVKMEIFFAPSTNWTMIAFNGHCVFAGTTMNISELKKTLKRIQGDDIIKE